MDEEEARSERSQWGWNELLKWTEQYERRDELREGLYQAADLMHGAGYMRTANAQVLEEERHALRCRHILVDHQLRSSR
jgi:hypothetical protein